ncbi:MAG: nickel pincer cofactor biosynthesis protein LarB [Verrucomicrobiae bacterium]|nr:nickel pincer cofactor biosynthesis protein LarB [Verrucomicrobiae bacterium]
MANNEPEKCGFTDLGFAKVDILRRERQGFPEVILCQGKTPAQVAAIFGELASRSDVVLATRASAEQFAAVRHTLPDARHEELARCIVWRKSPSVPADTSLKAAVLAAGTSDLPVAEEAAVTVGCFGFAVERLYDVGVAGLHRLLAHAPLLRSASVFVVAAGMEGALPSVVAGLVDKPVIAVPTSVGYGASFGGVAALLGMLNSCGSGVTVVNIDNGFGAGFAAGQILRLAKRAP